MITAALALNGLVIAGEIAIQDGQTIAFLGDSITAAGAQRPAGYAYRVVSGLDVLGIKVKPVYAGIGGHKSNQMLSRLEKDVLSKKPDWMTLSCGVNDVWHGDNGVKLEPYKANITKIVDTCQSAGVKVMLLTATMIGEEPDNDNNQKLAPYNAFIRQLAKDKKCLLAYLDADMRAGLKPDIQGNQLTSDGVHMNPMGNLMMATGLMKSFGLSADQLKQVREAWLDVPNACEIKGQTRVTQREYIVLQEKAFAEGKSVDAWLKDKVSGLLKDLMAE